MWNLRCLAKILLLMMIVDSQWWNSLARCDGCKLDINNFSNLISKDEPRETWWDRKDSSSSRIFFCVVVEDTRLWLYCCFSMVNREKRENFRRENVFSNNKQQQIIDKNRRGWKEYDRFFYCSVSASRSTCWMCLCGAEEIFLHWIYETQLTTTCREAKNIEERLLCSFVHNN